jgi:hypothetical protein
MAQPDRTPIAHLTQGQPWPVQPLPGIAVFTGNGPNGELTEALAAMGLTDLRHV